MTEFIRVRAKDGPKHEFDAPLQEVEANPELYLVVDSEPVTQPRDVTYITPEKKPSAPKSGASKPSGTQSTSKPATAKTAAQKPDDAPQVGDDSTQTVGTDPTNQE